MDDGTDRRMRQHGRLLLAAAFSRKRTVRPDEEPPATASLRASADVRLDAARLSAYRAVCGFEGESVPITYPQVLAAPLHLELLTAESFPYRALGVVHARNVIVQHRPLGTDGPLRLAVSTSPFRKGAAGLEVDLVTTASDGAGLAWEGVTTLLCRYPARPEAGRPKPRPLEPWPVPAAAWQLPADQGRRYARVSGDYNPIHLWPLTARLLGFRRPIAHGMLTLARSAAALAAAAPAPPSRLAVRFRRPVLLPADVAFQARAVEGGTAFRLTDAGASEGFLEGDWLAHGAGEPPPA